VQLASLEMSDSGLVLSKQQHANMRVQDGMIRKTLKPYRPLASSDSMLVIAFWYISIAGCTDPAHSGIAKQQE
jgi:hypothetical protein